MSLPPNKLQDVDKDVAPRGNKYARSTKTDAAGNYIDISLDSEKGFYTTQGWVTGKKEPSSFFETRDPSGTLNQGIPNAVKSMAGSETTTTRSHSERKTGGSRREIHNLGKYGESGEGRYMSSAQNDQNISGGTYSRLAGQGQSSGHHGVMGDYGFYVMKGGYSVGAEEHVAITSNRTIHFEADREISLKAKGGNAGMTTPFHIILNAFESISNFVCNAGNYFRAKGKQQTYITSDTQVVVCVGQNSGIIIAPDKITLKVGSTGIEITDGEIKLATSGSSIDIKDIVQVFSGGTPLVNPPWDVGASQVSVSGNIPNDPAPTETDGQGSNTYAPNNSAGTLPTIA
jgi:hypothetical protein